MFWGSLSTVYLHKHNLSKLDNLLDYHQPRNEEHVWWRVVSHVRGQELECWDTGASAHGTRGNKTNVILAPCSGSSLDRPRQCENCVMGKQLGNKTHKEMLTREKLVFWSITEQILGNTRTAQHNHITTPFSYWSLGYRLTHLWIKTNVDGGEGGGGEEQVVMSVARWLDVASPVNTNNRRSCVLVSGQAEAIIAHKSYHHHHHHHRHVTTLRW